MRFKFFVILLLIVKCIASLRDNLIPLDLQFAEKQEIVAVIADFESNIVNQFRRSIGREHVFVGVSEIDFTLYSFAVFNSSNSQIYKNAILADCIPIVVSSDLRVHDSYWLENLAWRIGVEDQIRLESFSKWIQNEYRSESFGQILLNFRIQKQILTYFKLPRNLCESENPQPFRVFIGILNRREDGSRRTLIRETWLKSFYTYPTVSIEHAFFVGSGPGELHESEKDIVVLNVVEEYINVGLKSSLMLNHIAENNQNESDIVIILDDDIYIRPARMLEILCACIGDSETWWGSFAHASMPVRDRNETRHFVSFDAFPYDAFYPGYTRGFAYAISTGLVRQVSMQNGFNHSIPFGDAGLGFSIFKSIVSTGTSVTIDDRFESLFAMFPECNSEYGGAHSDSIVIHKVSTQQIECLWNLDTSHSSIPICTCL